MNIYKRVPLLIGVVSIFTGCNVYRQVTVPDPSSYGGNENLGTVVDGSVSGNDSVAGTITDGGSSSSGEVVKETINTEGSIIPVKQSSISSKDKTVVKRIPFPENEYRKLSTTGHATVKGKIYVTTAGGNRVYGKNTRLYLNPVTSYSTQWYEDSYLGGAKMSKVDPRLFNYLKFTTSNMSGDFEFLNVPAGNYYLIGVVKCGVACGYDKVKNIRITKKVSVSGRGVKIEDLTKSIE